MKVKLCQKDKFMQQIAGNSLNKSTVEVKEDEKAEQWMSFEMFDLAPVI